jgi:hypothetical protein
MFSRKGLHDSLIHGSQQEVDHAKYVEAHISSSNCKCANEPVEICQNMPHRPMPIFVPDSTSAQLTITTT